MKWMRWVLLAMVTACAPAYAGGHGGYDTWSDEPFVEIVTDGTYEIASYIDPTGVSPRPPMRVALVPQDTHYANMEYHNEMVPIRYGPADIIDFIHEGFVFQVRLYPGIDNPEEGVINADRFTVVVPEGFYTIPEEITVEEGTMAFIEIHQYQMF